MGLFVLACLVGAVVSFEQRFALDPDALSYVDYGRVLTQTSFWHSPNGYWSPLFPLLLSIPYRFLAVDTMWMGPTAVGVFWLTFCLLLASYFYFEHWLVRFIEARDGKPWDRRRRQTLFLFGFLTVALSGIDVLWGYFNPDLLVASFFLLASGQLLKFKAGRQQWQDWLLFPLVLTLGYLSKAVFFVLGFAFVAALFFILRQHRHRWLATAGVLALFVTFSAIEWLPLSLHKGRFTFGDTGKINYVAQVGVSGTYAAEKWFVFWQTSPNGAPLKHPMGYVAKPVEVYDLNSPVPGVYPVWNDPSYWVDGLKFQFNLSRQLTLLAFNSQRLLTTLVDGFAWPLVALLTLGFILRWRWQDWRGTPWELALPALAGAGSYFLVVFLLRYCLAFISVSLIVAFGLGLALLKPGRLRFIWAVVVALSVTGLACESLRAVATLRTDLAHRSAADIFSDEHMRAARLLPSLGVPHGSAVAVLDAPKSDYIQLLLDGNYQLKGLVAKSEQYWNSSPADRALALEAVRATRAKALFCVVNGIYPDMQGWIPVGKTKYAVYLLESSPGKTSVKSP